MKFKIAMSHFYVPTQEWVDRVGDDQHYIHIGSGKRLHDTKDKWAKTNIVLDDSAPNNISDKNWTYNELTNLYCLWKNLAMFSDQDTEYFGLCHYRRRFDTQKLEEVLERDHPDIVCSTPAGIGIYDIGTQYPAAHNKDDFKLLLGLMQESFLTYKHPEVMQMWLNFRFLVAPYNTVVMKREMFHEWCSRMFPVLDDIFGKRVEDIRKRDDYQRRAIGFLGERFTSWFVTHKAFDGNKVVQMPIIFDADAKPADATDVRAN